MRSLHIVYAALFALAPCGAFAQAPVPVPPVKLSKPNGHGLKNKIAILSYSINFVTAQRASANATVGVKARAGTALIGVDEAMMRRLANEAFADLKAQMAAAGIPSIGDDIVARTARTAGVTLIPGNREENRDGGMTIGTGIKKAYVSVGADAAPLTDLYQSAGKVGGFGMLARFGKGNALSKPALELGAAFISPSLTIDFADADARIGRTLAGSRRASVEIEPQFAIRAPSPTNIQVGQSVGIAGPTMMTLSKDVVIKAPFSHSAGASAMQSEGAYLEMKQARPGDIIVDLPRWTALVQSAYRAYNASVVANLLAAR
ncbi:hypothetical protein [Sphingobium cloacae]|uniref:Uncharacterized protein n=1 Tax=Sphingobium cloacae TaxID=120107 RepID=A0A1E1F537_9SPHN|nr:hypothetical protein [Sphingobium cloacae]BAV65582.1 hypothetical protein SCLO_1025420 [Sphingobium cloacae]